MDLKSAIKLLESGRQISLTFITADITKGAGGKLMHFPHCRIARRRPVNRPVSAKEIPREVEGITRDPHHNYHFTRNVELPSREIRKVHPILIQKINDQEVI